MLERLTGNQSRLPFALILSLRSQFRDRRLSTVLSVLALASSVSLATIVEMSTRSIQVPLRSTANAMLGEAEISVSAGDVGVPEAWIEEIRAVEGVRIASPIINRTFRISGGDRDGEPVRLIAIDLLEPNGVRTFGTSRDGLSMRDPLRLLSSPNALIVSGALAKHLGIEEGEPLLLRSPGRDHEFVVRGTLTGPLAEAFGGQIAVLDVFGFQELLGFTGRVDRIDVALEPEADPEAIEIRIKQLVGDEADVQHAEIRAIYFDSVMSMVSFGVWSIAAMGTLLAVFLTYAVTSMNVDRRIEELVLLRTAGWPGHRVRSLILVDTAVLSVIATVMGFGIALFFADTLVGFLSSASSYLHNIDIPPSTIQASTFVVAVTVGVVVALFSAIQPARRVGRGRPLELLRLHRTPPASGRVEWRLTLVGGGASLVAVMAWAVPGAGLPGEARVLAVIAGSVLGVGILVPQLMLRWQRPLHYLAGRLSPRIGLVAVAAMLQRPVATGATLAIWCTITASLIAMFTLIHSFVLSLDGFWNQLHGPDVVVVTAQAPLATKDREPISRTNVEIIRSTDGVRAVAEYYAVYVPFRGDSIGLGSIATRVIGEQSDGIKALSDDPSYPEALFRGELAMNTTFAGRFGMEIGDEITLTTNHGPHAFRIGAVDRTYSGPTGGLLLDIDTFDRWFYQSSASQVAFWTDPASNQQAIRDEVQRRVTSQALFFRYGDAAALHTERVVAKFTGLLLLPVGMIGSVGALSLTALLLGHTAGRRRDFFVLRTAGASRSRISSMILWDGAFFGIVGTGIGVILGIPWSMAIGSQVADTIGFQAAYSVDTVATIVILLCSIGMSILVAGVAALIGRVDRIPTQGISQII